MSPPLNLSFRSLFTTPEPKAKGCFLDLYLSTIPQCLLQGFRLYWVRLRDTKVKKPSKLMTGSMALWIQVFFPNTPADIYLSEFSNSCPCILCGFYSWLQEKKKGGVFYPSYPETEVYHWLSNYIFKLNVASLEYILVLRCIFLPCSAWRWADIHSPVSVLAPIGGQGHSNIVPCFANLPLACVLTAQLMPTFIKHCFPLLISWHCQVS